METDRPGGFVYVASPYTHPSPVVREYRYLKVLHACAQLFNEGVVCYSPIVHWHEAAKLFEMPKDHTHWLLADSIMLSAAKEVAVLQLDGWEKSAGVQNEIKFAQIKGKNITYLADCLDLR